MKLEAIGDLVFSEFNLSANGINLLHVMAEHFSANHGVVTGKIIIQVIPMETSCTVDGVNIGKEAEA